MPPSISLNSGMNAIFKIEAGNELGTGFLIYDHVHILTAKHVVENSGGEKINVHNIDTHEIYVSSIQKIFEDWDAALLLLEKPIEDCEPLLVSRQQLRTVRFTTYGFPEQFGPNWYPGRITGPAIGGNYNVSFDMNLMGRLDGLSGAPVFLEEALPEDPSVVGIICEQDRTNPQAGKIVPITAFYDQMLEVLQNPAATSVPVPEKELWCYVIRSEADREAGAYYTLQRAVKDAMMLLKKEYPEAKDTPECHYATDLVESPEKYAEAVKKLCHAKIAIFDITNYEPAVMLLLGIRSVVKRGVTIASFGKQYLMGEAIDIPFNIKDLNIISHSSRQEQTLEEKKPADIIGDKIRKGLNQLKLLPHQYLDLPAFDAVRNLPPRDRTTDASDILVLCSYSEKYQSINWQGLWNRLRLRLKPGGKIRRVLDLNSPRLVSPIIYEAIRLTGLCIVDWTEWRPNVFFELGVRLAVTHPTRFTVCTIAGMCSSLIEQINNNLAEFKSNHDAVNNLIWQFHYMVGAKETADERFLAERDRYLLIARQCAYLKSLFHPIEYNPLPSPSSGDTILGDQFPFDDSPYETMMYYYEYRERGDVAARANTGLAPYLTYDEIQKHIHPDGEAVSIPVYKDLLRTAQLFEVDPSVARTAVLYPENQELQKLVDKGVTQRLLAAWYFVRTEYKDKDEEIIVDDELYKALQDIGSALYSRITDSRPEQAEEIYEILRSLQAKKEDHS